MEERDQVGLGLVDGEAGGPPVEADLVAPLKGVVVHLRLRPGGVDSVSFAQDDLLVVFARARPEGRAGPNLRARRRGESGGGRDSLRDTRPMEPPKARLRAGSMALLLSAGCPPPAFLILGSPIRRPPPPRGQPSRLHPRARGENATRLRTNPLRDPRVRVDTELMPAGPSPSSIPKKSSRSIARSPADSPFSTASGGGFNATSFAAEQGP